MPNQNKNTRDMWTSVSAIIDADDCKRRWWFAKVVKLPQPQRTATIFGDVFHAVLERYFKADDRGLDNNGQIVNLYPDGWQTMQSRFGKDKTPYTISDAESALTKTLINEAIIKGILVREPDRITEKAISTIIYKKGFAKVVLKGFIDLDAPKSITDHKTAKSTTYILSLDKLKKSIQMMGYAYAKYVDGHKGSLWLTHNNFIKDFDRPQVIQRSVEVSEIEVFDFFNNSILPLVKRMMELYLKYPKTLIHKWRDIPGADNPNKSCNYHYGKPCPFIGICSGMCDIDSYLNKYGTTVNKLVGNIKTKLKGDNKMGLLDRIAKGNKNIAALTSDAATAPPEEETSETKTDTTAPTGSLSEMLAKMKPALGGTASELSSATKSIAAIASSDEAQQEKVVDIPAAEAVVENITGESKQRAPWYMEYNGAACVACKDNAVLGYSSNKVPCRICDIRAKEAGRATSGDYQVDVNDDGSLTFNHKMAQTTEEIAKVQVTAPPESKSDVVAAEAQNSAEAKPAVADTQAGTIEDVKVFGAGFNLLIGCTYVSEFNGLIIYADKLLVSILEDCAKAAGKEAYLIEHFALMQAIDACIPALLNDLNGFTVISLIPSKGSAHARLIDGLRPLAKSIICPLAV